MKKIMWIILGILLISLVTAGVVGLIKITMPTNPTGIEGEIYFKVDGTDYNCTINEPDGNIDNNDIISCAEGIGIAERKKLTDIKDWNGNYLKEDGSWGK